MISSIKIIVELFAYLYCLAGLFGKKFRLSIHAMILLALDLFLLTGINEYGFPVYLVLLLYMGMFVYGLLFYGGNIKTIIVNCFLAAVLVTFLQFILCFPLYVILMIGYEQNGIYELLINLGSLITIMYLSHRKVLVKIAKYVLKNNKIFFILLFMLLFGMGINVLIMKSKNSINGTDYLQLIYFAFIFILIIWEWQKSRMDAEKRKAQLEMNKLYYGAYDQLIMVIRDRQHDMKNHISAILSMIHTTNDYEELVTKQQEYCGYVMEQNEKTKLLLSSGNPLITGFLYSKILEAEEKGIDVKYSIEIKKEIKFPEYELVEMLGILLDNAIEALEKVQISKKCLHISVKEEQEKIIILVANNGVDCKKENISKFFDRGYSSKGENRGIGLSKLKYLVDGKKGDLIVYNEKYKEEDFLMFEIVLPKI